MDWVVAPVDHTLPVADEAVKATLPPAQKVVGPPGVTVGVAGNGFTVTVVPADAAEVQPPLVTVTVYVPPVETVIDWVVAPVDHKLPVAEDEVKVTLPPAQNVVGPPAVMVGVGGVGFTVTVVPADVAALQPAMVTVTVYVPAVETVMACVVAPVDQRLPVADEDVKVTLPPAQNVVGPPAVIVGVGGTGFTVPETATLMVVTPVEASVIFPEGLPVADAAILTYIVVLATEPLDGVKVRVVPKLLPLVVETSKPVGAVMMIPVVRLLPETVKLCSAEAVPAQLVKAVNAPVLLITGAWRPK
jgi:hypothetical protein